ncbi:hypothetical protein DIE16_32005 [Burkholderia sp. Bp9090]|nr:hypothetical protein DIE16_32005 [Burkholderia sp. Bp9090]
MFAITRFHNFMSVYQGRYVKAFGKALNTSVFAAGALEIALATGAISLDKLHLLLGCSRGQAVGAALDLQELGLVRDIESTRNRSNEFFLVPIDKKCEAARLYRAKLEQLAQEKGVYDSLERVLPALQSIFMESLAALEEQQVA